MATIRGPEYQHAVDYVLANHMSAVDSMIDDLIEWEHEIDESLDSLIVQRRLTHLTGYIPTFIDTTKEALIQRHAQRQEASQDAP